MASFVVKVAVNEIGGTGRVDTPARFTRELAGAWGVSPVAILALAFAGIIFVQASFRVLWRWGIVMSSQRVARRMRADLFGHLETQDAEYYDRTPTGEMLSVAASDIDALRLFYGLGILLAADTLVYLAMVPATMASIDLSITLILLLPLPAIPLVTHRLGQTVHARFEECQERIGKIAARAQEGIAGVRVVKAFVQSENEIRDFEALARESLVSNTRLARAQSVFQPSLAFFVSIEIFLVMWFGSAAVRAGSLDAGELVQMLLLSLILVHPMRELGWLLSLHQRARASFGRFRRVLDSRPAIADDVAAIEDRPILGRIEFAGLTFRYPGANRPALAGVDLAIEAGETVAVVGPVGSGKSTLAALVARFRQAERDMVRVDGVDVRSIPLAFLRRSIGYVSQNPFLFSRSIRDNIAFGEPQASDERVVRAAERASLAATIEDFPERYATLLGERGVNLSGGQKQRLAIARAILAEPAILILDDCLSAVDAKTEESILRNLEEVLAGKTAIVVTHRLSAVVWADRIAVLEEGRLAEVGTHDELVRSGGWYARTFRSQTFEKRYKEEALKGE